MEYAHKLEYQRHLLEAIESNNFMALKEFYVFNYPEIESLVLSDAGTKEDAKAMYQEAFMTVWNNIKSTVFIPENDSALNDYLFTVAKNKWIVNVHFKQLRKTQSLTPEHMEFINNKEYDGSEAIENKKLRITMEAFKDLEEPCKKLLTTFYFDKKSLQDIATDLSLDEASIRNKKYNCVEKLRTILLASK